MICYDVVNPSDACTFLAPDREIALAVLAFLGEGAYAGRPIAKDLKPIGEGEVERLEVPIFMFGRSYDGWWKDHYAQEPIGAALTARPAEVVAALRSTQYGRVDDRIAYQSACNAITDPERLKTFQAEWEDRHRSSLNAIVKRAWIYADRIEATEAAGKAA